LTEVDDAPFTAIAPSLSTLPAAGRQTPTTTVVALVKVPTASEAFRARLTATRYPRLFAPPPGVMSFQPCPLGRVGAVVLPSRQAMAMMKSRFW
jgi:hypothetical protein